MCLLTLIFTSCAFAAPVPLAKKSLLQRQHRYDKRLTKQQNDLLLGVGVLTVTSGGVLLALCFRCCFGRPVEAECDDTVRRRIKQQLVHRRHPRNRLFAWFHRRVYVHEHDDTSRISWRRALYRWRDWHHRLVYDHPLESCQTWEAPPAPALRAPGTAANSIELPRTGEADDANNGQAGDSGQAGASDPENESPEERVRRAAEFFLEPERRQGPLSREGPLNHRHMPLAHPAAVHSPRQQALVSRSRPASRCPSRLESRAASPSKSKPPERPTVTFAEPETFEQRLQEPGTVPQGGSHSDQTQNEQHTDRRHSQATNPAIPGEAQFSTTNLSQGQPPANDEYVNWLRFIRSSEGSDMYGSSHPETAPSGPVESTQKRHKH